MVMKEYMQEYIKNIDEYIEAKQHKNLEEVIEEHLIKIKFFQHERFVHLFVTLFYALFCIVFFALIALSIIFVPITIILFIFLICYIFHYFYLENSVQYMYKQYDKLKKLG